MPVSAKQLTFSNISSDFDKFYNQNQDNLLSLLDKFINISDFIPFSFYQSYYSKFGSKRDFSLESMLNAFILKNILSIPSIDLLITFLSSILITDTTGFEAYVTENNPKFYQSELRKSKSHAKYFKKNNPNSVFDVEKYAQGQMPKHSLSNPDAKLAYLNGHFGYFLKGVISTNGLGLVRDVNFFEGIMLSPTI